MCAALFGTVGGLLELAARASASLAYRVGSAMAVGTGLLTIDPVNFISPLIIGRDRSNSGRGFAIDLDNTATPLFLINGEMVPGFNRPLLEARLRGEGVVAVVASVVAMLASLKPNGDPAASSAIDTTALSGLPIATRESLMPVNVTSTVSSSSSRSSSSGVMMIATELAPVGITATPLRAS